ncbi:MAG: polyprenyl synthetase family protein, partial [Flavobacteriaceae bacterium]|nr:polyprenyl synthetase family protein [Flavobacteriaceae bacterium]
MHPFQELIEKFNQDFDTSHFPSQPATLYEPSEYFLKIGGKRIRPVLCLLGNELFSDLHPDAFLAAKAVELFHNFSLVHDDMMDEANLRRGQPTVHTKYDANTALLVGDIMVIRAYEYLQPIQPNHLSKILGLFNQTAREVCEGQQLDMDYAKRTSVSMEEYIHMITLKTSVLLAASLQMGAIIGGAGEHNCSHLYAFGKKLGIAFQIQDDYLDAFGDAAVFGKDAGGDIKQNKKTFLLIRALETANPEQLKTLNVLLSSDPADKVEQVLAIFKACKVDAWAEDLKQKYMQEALAHLEAIAVANGKIICSHLSTNEAF